MPLTAVIGTGSWGTAASVLVARNGGMAVLYGRDAGKVATIARSRSHPQFPGTILAEAISVTADAAAMADADLVLWAVPTQHTRAQARLLAASIHPSAMVVSLSKGLEQGTLARVTDILAEELPGRAFGCLSGPSHATEVVAGLPVCLVVAGSTEVRERTQTRLHAARSRLYTSADMLGVELGGALKNVVAIAAAICEGLGFGDNTKAAMITRGLAEMRRLGRAMGANDATFSGMAGVGDLLTTCYSPHGRNRALGLAIARGENPLEILKRLHTVAEGAWTSRAAVELGRRHHVELPIASQVASVIWDAKPVPQAMEQLLARAPKEEDA
ncbi:MAG: NAD(P)-dependent glycerol-3-phosphate dehydrogenase [Planctomycetes bacterium]|nr:NAD(P)-dependent glycerol-3-phosphate dehydrogenase [Planctomycetota bacterium]